MKKVMSVFLAVLMLLGCAVPVLAAGETARVSFIAPSSSLITDDDGTPPYMFVVSHEGNVDFKLDENGVYVYDGDCFRPYYNLTSSELEKYTDRYSPVEMTSGDVELGSVVTFRVLTNRVYNNATVAVFVNGSEIKLNENDEYSVVADRNLVINVAERNESTGEEYLLKNHYSVTWESGDGYRIRTLENENYKLIYYGGEFYFRVKTLKGYSSSGMSVKVLRNVGSIERFPEEMGNALALLGEAETLSSYGTDSEGFRLYKISDITSDCKIYVMGVRQEQTAGIFAKFKRIIRLLLNLLGIKIPSADDMLADHKVTVDTTGAVGISYEVVCSGAVNVDSGSFLVLDGDTATVKVKASEPYGAVVSWTPGNEDGTMYQASWIPQYDYSTGETYYEAVFNIENICADTVITIKAH